MSPVQLARVVDEILDLEHIDWETTLNVGDIAFTSPRTEGPMRRDKHGPAALAEQVGGGLLTMTCALDGRNHMVTDGNFLRRRHVGIYLALCGHAVQVCSMYTGGKRCDKCRELSEDWVTLPAIDTEGARVADLRLPLAHLCASWRPRTSGRCR